MPSALAPDGTISPRYTAKKQHVMTSTHKTHTANGCKRTALQPLIPDEPMELAMSINPDAFPDLAILYYFPVCSFLKLPRPPINFMFLRKFMF
ncbi:hypothetical protein [Burkholderia vietnamiensis]|uniref:hypothetical protein n=1 Tax=Burkholderia vietnamiensis TaxID=60552 RepID=UPI001CC66940|nr:hypothetical protein [Burkholderia vietnamiensis]HDR8963109.1 hypothetical protein [Burkholderia vietnamiensis]